MRSLPLFVLMAILLGVAASALAGSPAADLHLEQELTVRRESTPMLTERREILVHDRGVLLRTPQATVLLRLDLQRAWLFDPQRTPLSELPFQELLGTLRTQLNQGTPPVPMPALQTARATRTIQGLRCQVYTATTSLLTVEACITRQLAALEQFQTLTGGPIDIPGVPVDFRVRLQMPNQPPFLIQQALDKVTVGPLDPTLFASPVLPTRSPVPRSTPPGSGR